MMTTDWLQSEREQLLIVRDPGELARFVRGRYPQFEVTVSPTYLAGVTALANRSARGLLVGVDPTARRLESAIAGLRKAAGPAARIVLCCLPSGEPMARGVMSAGANDYLIYPPNGKELDSALGLPPAGAVVGDLTPTETMPTWDELMGLAAGLPDAVKWLERHFVDPVPLLKKLGLL